MTPQARRQRLALVTVSIVAVLGLLILARGALFPFILSGAISYLLFPIVKTLESLMPWRDRWPGASRLLAIAVIYIAAIAVVAGALALIIPQTFREGREFIASVPALYADARASIEDWNKEYADRIPEDIRQRIEDALSGNSTTLIDAGKRVVAKTFGGVLNVVTSIIGLAIIPLLVFYLLKDREVAVEGAFSLLPPEARRHAQNVVSIVNRVVGAYVRAQLTLGIFVGILVFIGLFALDVRYAALLAVIAGLTELVPVIGPLLGAIPGILVTLATSPEDILWVILLYAGIQIVENVVLVPRIQGQAVDIHPAIIMLLLVIGSETAGLWGVILAVPLAAVARDVFIYFHHEWSEEAPAIPAEVATEPVASDSEPAPLTDESEGS